MEPLNDTEHRRAAIEANNSTWELLDGRPLDHEASADLLGRAYAAMYHWRRAADRNDANAARAAWLVSRTHAVLGHGDLALQQARRAGMPTDHDGSFADFDAAYAHEAEARAMACLGRRDEAIAAFERARSTPIAKAADRNIFLADLQAEPWFGVIDEPTSAFE